MSVPRNIDLTISIGVAILKRFGLVAAIMQGGGHYF